MIDTPEALAAYLPGVAAAPRVALDTEADSLHCYREKLCLVQVTLPDEPSVCTLIDPLAGAMPMAPFFAALEGKPLLLHGADYDLRLMKRTAGFVPAEIFDTMIAARLVGRRAFSLAALVQEEFGVEMTKASQKANWARRPLTAQMIAYAQMDTRYLFELEAILDRQLREKGRRAWFDQSCRRLIDNVRASEEERSRDEDAWRIQGAGSLRGRASALLRALWHWRDAEASEADRPPFHILRNEELLTVARHLDGGGKPPAWRHVRGSRLRRFHDAVERAMALSPEEWPPRPRGNGKRPTAEMDARMGELKKRRDDAAAELDLDPTLIASRAVIEGLAYRAEPPESTLLPWQRELLAV